VANSEPMDSAIQTFFMVMLPYSSGILIALP
jgi:hypothetical protein